jgi:hypothetical protein
MCPQQRRDLEELLSSIDDFGAATLGLTSSNPQAYTTFIEAKSHIRNQVQNKFKNYRLVTVEQ